MGIPKAKRERLRKDHIRTVAWLRAAAAGDDDGAAVIADRLGNWFSGDGAEPTNIDRFRDAAKVLRGGTVDYMPAAPASTSETTASVLESSPAVPETETPAPDAANDESSESESEAPAKVAEPAKRGGGILGRRRGKANR